jgi:hypothetical protein
MGDLKENLKVVKKFSHNLKDSVIRKEIALFLS